jgi:hypothetical protein
MLQLHRLLGQLYAFFAARQVFSCLPGNVPAGSCAVGPGDGFCGRSVLISYVWLICASADGDNMPVCRSGTGLVRPLLCQDTMRLLVAGV